VSPSPPHFLSLPRSCVSMVLDGKVWTEVEGIAHHFLFALSCSSLELYRLPLLSFGRPSTRPQVCPISVVTSLSSRSSPIGSRTGPSLAEFDSSFLPFCSLSRLLSNPFVSIRPLGTRPPAPASKNQARMPWASSALSSSLADQASARRRPPISSERFAGMSRWS
jgi:hypothetical protein